MRTKGQKGLTPTERILSRVDIDSITGCWNWQGSMKGRKPTEQYGQLQTGSRTLKTRKLCKAHRYSYEAFIGPIPDGLHVLHKCDNPKCANPEHLFLGTNKDNVEDKMRKGRYGTIPKLSGENHPRAKLSWEDVAEIRAANNKFTHKELAEKYNVKPSAIASIQAHKNWKNKMPSHTSEFTEDVTLNVIVKFQFQNKYGTLSDNPDSYQIGYFIKSKKEAEEIILKTKKAIQSI